MATRMLLKLKPNLNLPLRFFQNPSFSLTRSVSPFTRPDSTTLSLLKPSTVLLQGTLARQMATARSPRGASRMEEEEDDHDDGDFDDDDEDEIDLNDEFDDSDCDEFDDEDEDEDEDEEEEKPKGKKTNHKKW